MAKPARVAAHDRREIKALPDQRHDQPRKVVPRHIVLHPRRQQLHIVDLPGAKFLAHNHAWNQTLHNLTSHYSDRLLVVAAANRVLFRTAGTLLPLAILLLLVVHPPLLRCRPRNAPSSARSWPLSQARFPDIPG